MSPTSVNELRVELLSDVPDSESTTVLVSGEIDVASAGTFQEAIDVAIEPGRRLILDMAGVSFIDSSGVAVLVGIVERASSLVIQNPDPRVRRILGVLGLTDHFGLDDSPPTLSGE